ncbi:hypothetical protein MIMGU_mgv1a0189721mg, partial [Erythranthe guttata]
VERIIFMYIYVCMYMY